MHTPFTPSLPKALNGVRCVGKTTTSSLSFSGTGGGERKVTKCQWAYDFPFGVEEEGVVGAGAPTDTVCVRTLTS